MKNIFTVRQLKLHALNRTQKFGPSTLFRIYTASDDGSFIFDSAKHDFLSEEQKELMELVGSKFDAQKESQDLRDQEIYILDIYDDRYPQILKEIPTPPPLLYYRGNIELLKDIFALAIVGTRKITPYGKLAAHKIIPELVKAEFIIVSGLAMGVDALAHEITLEHKGKAIAVLGTGIDDASIYPRANRGLANRIIKNGGLLFSEYAPGSEPQKFHFPVRNRIISGLTLGTLVIEAHQKSGSLITAQAALDQQRNVYAVPGQIHASASQGTNHLIQQGAKMVVCAKDVLQDFQHIHIADSRLIQQSFELLPAEQIILSLLTESLEIDSLVEQSQLTISQVTTGLMMLELKGLIKQIGSQLYVKI